MASVKPMFLRVTTYYLLVSHFGTPCITPITMPKAASLDRLAYQVGQEEARILRKRWRFAVYG